MLIANYTDSENPEFSGESFHNVAAVNREPVDSLPLLQSKLRMPRASPSLRREKLLNYASKALDLCGTLIVHGRAETGKTMLAVDLAARCSVPVAWYNVESTDSDWSVFYSYFSRSLRDFNDGKKANAGN